MGKRFFHENGLSIVLITCFLVFLGAQSITGNLKYNEEREDEGQSPLSYIQYLGSSHFLEATMENWESEFLQMFVYVIFTIFLYQKGSSESKKLPEEGPEEEQSGPSKASDAPWPVRAGGLMLKLYENSLALAFLFLFLFSFTLHVFGSIGVYNQEQILNGKAPVSVWHFLGTAYFWFESFQNWQSEFLAIASMVIFTIYLRQKGSSESKPVESPHHVTGK